MVDPIHPVFYVMPLMLSLYSWYFNIRLFLRNEVPPYYWVIDKVAISDMDLTFYYGIAHILWVITLMMGLIQHEYWLYSYFLYGTYFYHGLIHLFCLLVSLDTYNEFSEFWFTWTFSIITNCIHTTWAFWLLLPTTPWIYWTIIGVIIWGVICIKGMKENFEEEQRMLKEMHEARSGTADM